MCLPQGPQRSDAGEAGTCGPSVLRVKYSTIEPLRSLIDVIVSFKFSIIYEN